MPRVQDQGLSPFFWFSVMGGAGLYRQIFGDGGLVDPEEGVIAESALFDLLSGLPIGGILSVLAIVVIAIFFITSSDSGSLVVDMLASGGHPNPPTWSRVLFSGLEGLIAAALLIAGGLTVIQAAGLITALPFSVILILMVIATVKAMRTDLKKREDEELEKRYLRVSEMLQDDFDSRFGSQVDTRVDNRIDYRLERTTGPVTGRLRRLKGDEKK
ncbi:BCCT family transporter [Kocuria palustris]|nr:BCCT family transporter [Kocuria palustris]MDH5152305.1 BCCT family transporter [Kocuria palustris]